MSKVPEVSVVMAVYNGEHYITEAINSVCEQCFQDWELIIVDDGSTDSTLSIICKFTKSDTRIKYYCKENGGQTKALNFGLEHCEGNYIARLDADDVMQPDRLKKQIQFFQEHDHYGLLGTAVVLIDNLGESFCTIVPPAESKELKKILIQRNPFFHSSVMAPVKVVKELGGYVALTAQDYELWMKIAQKYEIANLPEPLVKVRIHTENVSYTGYRKQALSTLRIQWNGIKQGWYSVWNLIFTFRWITYAIMPPKIYHSFIRLRKQRQMSSGVMKY